MSCRQPATRLDIAPSDVTEGSVAILGIPVRYLVKHPTAARPLVVHPRDAWVRLPEAHVRAREPQGRQQYIADDDWQKHLHAATRRFNQRRLFGIVLARGAG
jgi:hypothetical protein